MSDNCSNNCSSCGEDCTGRETAKQDLLEPANKNSNIKKVIGIVSGKGGVGKSFVTSYLSVLFQRKGYQAAILDADITGPSIPKSFGLHEKAYATKDGIIPAVTKTGIKVMSVNLILEEEDTPVIWRGPVIASTVKQFWSDVVWGDIDYMFVDMPPGTGDVPLTVFQSLPLDGIIIVTSPQELVSMIVSKAIKMADAMDVPVLGIIENYSYILCPDCNKKIHMFGKSHAAETAEKFGLNLLSELPVAAEIVEAVDKEKIEELQGDWLDNVLEGILSELKMISKREESFDLKIAVPVQEEEEIFQHFGKTEQFMLYEFKENQLLKKDKLMCGDAGHEALAALLSRHGVQVLLCGGIGSHAIEALKLNGIEIIGGISGYADVAVSEYLSGGYRDYSATACNHHEEDNGCQNCCH